MSKKDDLEKERAWLIDERDKINRLLKENYDELDMIELEKLESIRDGWWLDLDKAKQIGLWCWGSGVTAEEATRLMSRYFERIKPEGIRMFMQSGWRLTGDEWEDDFGVEFPVVQIGFERESKADLEGVWEAIVAHASTWGYLGHRDFYVSIMDWSCSAGGVWSWWPFEGGGGGRVKLLRYGHESVEAEFREGHPEDALEWIREHVWYESSKRDELVEEDLGW